MQDPHEIRCQHCYVVIDLCNGIDCSHDVHANVPGESLRFGLSARGSAYVGFCEPDCSKTRPKGSRSGEYAGNPRPEERERIRAAAYATAETANAAIGKVVTISMRALSRILREHGLTVDQMLTIIFDVEKEGKTSDQ